METKKSRFIDLTKQYIEDIEPLLDINEKICLTNIKFTSYQVMQIQGWYLDNTEQKNGIITHPAKKAKFNKSKQYRS